MSKGKKNRCLLSVGMMLCVIFSCTSVLGKTDDTKFIQHLIDNTGVGEECIIPKGDYKISGLSIVRPIILRGYGDVTFTYFNEESICEEEKSHILAVWSNNVTIEGFSIDNSSSSENAGIIHFSGDGLKIRNNQFYIGQNSVGITSYGRSNGFILDNNLITTEYGRRTHPMIHLGDRLSDIHIVNNTLEGDFPDILTPDFRTCFLKVESRDANFSSNEFSYTGMLNNEDLGGFEDPEMPIALEVFASLTENHIRDNNPWIRSLGNKVNPETGDGLGLIVLCIIFAIQFLTIYVHHRVCKKNTTYTDRRF